MKNENVLYSSGAISVTSSMLRYRQRFYSIARIENLVLTRPLLKIAVLISALISGFAFLNRDILFELELFSLLFVSTVLPLIALPFGTLYIQSRTMNVNMGSITYWHWRLAEAQKAIENTMTNAALR